ncbi:Dihydropteroate synthase [Viridothelium virens]|uniref:Dihydropteroate synthase n=1 Tax=Viridothelium virens TaxID=1048519 RepID=A0A6A6HGK8_VIRVR|nr:Dihydropteroate synthase [Viridothelium virens]
MSSPSSNAVRSGHTAIVAFGSNVGDRIDMIEQACRKLDGHPQTRVLRTSCLWETKPMYFEDQDNFLNGVCEVSTSLEPEKLLDLLQDIEKDLGRVKVIDKGPRTVDLDIVLYDDIQYASERLTIPHALMLEREFVLRPLCELIPDAAHPKYPTMSYRHVLARLPKSDPPMSTVTPLAPGLPPIIALNPSRHTQIMAIINLTPDSFSDGGLHSPSDTTSLQTTLLSALNSGATILDLGGQSSRPHAAPIPDSTELARLAPALHLLRSLSSPSPPSPPSSSSSSSPQAKTNPPRFAISIDTYRASVAHAAITAGAHLINDISAGTLDPAMLRTVASLGCSICLMHMRGDPQTMMQPPHTTYAPELGGVLGGVARELRARVAAAEAAGVRRWRILLDPGLGFAKTAGQSLELVRGLANLREAEGLSGLPWVLGPSRKGFVGKALGVGREPGEREWGSAAAVAACVQGGADVVRVHEVGAMRDVVRVSDAIWRV